MHREEKRKCCLHALNEDGMVLCNPRDKEAALRAQTEGIAINVFENVSCPICLLILYKKKKASKKSTTKK